jgi:hypothetical protein
MVNRRAGLDSVRQPPSTKHAPDLDSSGDGESAPKGKHGGKRSGAGRPSGSKNTLPLGAVHVLDAARVAKRRLGKDPDPSDLAALELVYRRVGDVLTEGVDYRQAGHVLKAGAMVADALAGPIAQKVEHGGSVEITKIERVVVDAGGAK